MAKHTSLLATHSHAVTRNPQAAGHPCMQFY
jgi:hypothetical protein